VLCCLFHRILGDDARLQAGRRDEGGEDVSAGCGDYFDWDVRVEGMSLFIDDTYSDQYNSIARA
jgi:hypothetical protein